MRGLVGYILASIVVVVAMDIVAPPVGFGIAGVAQPVTSMHEPAQTVDRTRKSDRLRPPKTNEGQKHPGAPPMPIGCEAAFSSLSGGARANFPGRCLAQRTIPAIARG
jgi:hypothetical protein